MIVFNIGLNNNPYKVKEILARLNYLVDDTYTSYKTGIGEYVGAEEPTLVVSYDDPKVSSIKLEILCMWLQQECIAYKLGGVGYMAFNPKYTGERYKFDEQFFINL